MAKNKVDYSLPWKIECVLFALTDGVYGKNPNEAHPTHAICTLEIKKKLEKTYSTTVDKGTIQTILLSGTAIKPAELGANQPIKIRQFADASLWCIKKSAAKNGKVWYFVTRNFGKAELAYLLQLVCTTASGANENDITHPLLNMLSETDVGFFYSELESTFWKVNCKTNPFNVRFSDTLKCISTIQEAINKRQAINYNYLIKENEARTYKNCIPLRTQIIEGYPYLVEYDDKAEDCHLVRIDMMRGTTISDAINAVVFPSNFDELRNGIALDFVRGAVNRRAGNNVSITARCHKKGKCKYVKDIFGGKEGYRVKRSTKDYTEYTFVASFKGTLDQAVKWADFFEIIEPHELREEVIERLENNVYGKKEETAGGNSSARL